MHEITERGPLLDDEGRLREPGWAKSLLLDYDRHAIRAKKSRIKEWDYYLIYDDELAIALTVDDNGYMGLASASWIDFSKATEQTTSRMVAMPMGQTGLPSSSRTGTVHADYNGVHADFLSTEDKRELGFTMHGFSKADDVDPAGGRFAGDKSNPEPLDFTATFTLTDIPSDSMVIATPFPDHPHYFYYNQKIVGMRARGLVTWGTKVHEFDPAKSFAILDWGRGVWTYDNTWYWGGACGMQGGHLIGWNIGYGFGDTSAASENMLFIDGKAHKLDQITFNIPGDTSGAAPESVRYMDPWTFTSNDGRFQMDFTPILDRKSKTDLKLIMSDQHQVFGRYSGTVVNDAGVAWKITDQIGFAEKVRNKW